ncbi:MAG: hypothetical protein U0169_04885 [Polyangiaceae bacterium]
MSRRRGSTSCISDKRCAKTSEAMSIMRERSSFRDMSMGTFDVAANTESISRPRSASSKMLRSGGVRSSCMVAERASAACNRLSNEFSSHAARSASRVGKYW